MNSSATPPTPIRKTRIIGSEDVGAVTLYGIRVTNPDGKVYTVKHHFAEFIALHEKLVEKLPNVIPEAPPRRGPYSSGSKREAVLDDYLRALCILPWTAPVSHEGQLLLNFLGTESVKEGT